jgi:hypothetical protein
MRNHILLPLYDVQLLSEESDANGLLQGGVIAAVTQYRGNMARSQVRSLLTWR